MPTVVAPTRQIAQTAFGEQMKNDLKEAIKGELKKEIKEEVLSQMEPSMKSLENQQAEPQE